MSPFLEVVLILLRELRKNFRSLKGIALGLLTLLGGSSIALLFAKFEELKREKLGQLDPSQLRDLQREALGQIYEAATADWLADAPDSLIVLLNITIWLTPLLVALMGFDAIAPDLQHRSVRYWTLRTRRPSYFVGKWAGLWATISAVTLTMDVIVWLVSIFRGSAPAASVVAWGFKFWLISLPLSAVWCAIAVVISSMFRAPMIALLATFGAFFVLWVIYLSGGASHVDALLYVYPNHYDRFLLTPKVERLGTGLLATFGMAAAYVAAGATLFTKRDV